MQKEERLQVPGGQRAELLEGALRLSRGSNMSKNVLIVGGAAGGLRQPLDSGGSTRTRRLSRAVPFCCPSATRFL